MSKEPFRPIENLSVSFSLGAIGDGKAEPKALPNHKTGTPNGFPPVPGIIALAGLRYERAG